MTALLMVFVDGLLITSDNKKDRKREKKISNKQLLKEMQAEYKRLEELNNEVMETKERWRTRSM